MKIDEILALKTTAVVDGDVVTDKLVIEEGAKFNGKCTMGVKEVFDAAETAKKSIFPQKKEAI